MFSVYLFYLSLNVVVNIMCIDSSSGMGWDAKHVLWLGIR